MGADRRMFSGPWQDLTGFTAHDWPEWSGERSIGEFARTVADALDIRDGDTLVGTSLGGMVACEIAKLRQTRALFLIGSAVSAHEVNRLLAWLHPLAGIAPMEWLAITAGKIPSELPQMFAGADADFLRSMCAAVFRWDGLGDSPVRCFRIHGKHDLVIPAPQHTDLLLDGGHLIAMTHASECVDFVRDHTPAD